MNKVKSILLLVLSVFSMCVKGETKDGHEYVDLGLPSGLKWATMNIGATKPEEYGKYFAWGEVKVKNSYDKTNSITYSTSANDKNVDKLKSAAIIGESGNLTAKYDAATVNWSENWRMPTKAEFEELRENCTWVWSTINGVVGYKVESKKTGNNNWIFLPATGYYNGSLNDSKGNLGLYWSSTIYDNLSYYAYGLNFNPKSGITAEYDRYYGRTIRPVVK